MAWSGQDEGMSQWTPRNYMYDNFCFLQTELTEDTCHHLIADLSKWILSDESKGKMLNFFINSPGGQVNIMNQISGLITLAKLRDIHVVTWVLGSAASSASLIAVQGDERIMTKNAHHFVHFGCFFDMVTKQTEIEKTYLQNKDLHDRICQIYLKNCPGLTEEKLLKLMEDERGTIMGDECKKLGFCDSILDDELDVLLDKKNQEKSFMDDFEAWKKDKQKSSKKGSIKNKKKK